MNERNSITNFNIGWGAITVLFLGVARIDAGGALVVTEGFAEGFVATTQNPVDDFAFGHGIKIVGCEITFDVHRTENISEEVIGSTGLGTVIFGEKWERFFHEIFADVEVAEAEFVDAVFVFQDDDVVRKSLHVV